ncbi:LOW QUALITY PROTEIN: hypothetical protein MKX08_005987 [Trichoderma sp. CBMAI-0020]|nr:LOW QUALITY PROTEIN: hypothetical protein MKX08_005987 [Trichoderma sp. CBMAI-0020]
MDRNGPTESRAKRAEERKRESEVEGGGEKEARDADARQKKRLEMSWRAGDAPRRRLCSVKPQCPRQRRCQHPSAASFPRTARSKTQTFVFNGGKKTQEAKSAPGDSVREREKRQERAREKTLAMTCGRSIVRPASVSRSETWDGENPGLEVQHVVCALLAV